MTIATFLLQNIRADSYNYFLRILRKSLISLKKNFQETTGRRSSQSSNIWKSLLSIRKKAKRKKTKPITSKRTCVLTGQLFERQRVRLWSGSSEVQISGRKEPDAVMPTVRHRCEISSKEAVLPTGAMTRG